MKLFLPILLAFLHINLPLLSGQDKPLASDFNLHGATIPTTPGYYLGFKSLSDELRVFNRPPMDELSQGFLHSFYFDFRYSSQNFNQGFYSDNNIFPFDNNRSNKTPDPNSFAPGNIHHDMYGITLGFSLGNNPNLDVKIPLAVSRFEVDHLDDTGFVGGVELFPNYRINDYVAWGVNLAYINSVSDFPIFDESMTSVSFEAMAESNPAYGINWSGRISIGNYFPSNADSFWLYRGNLALHFQINQNFIFVPYFGINVAPDDLAVNGAFWLDYGLEFAFNPLSSWAFSLGLSGIAGHDIIDHGMEFYASSKVNF